MAPVYDGIRVLDLTTSLAGVTAAGLLADFGADVVRVESPPIDGGLPPRFVSTHRNKRFAVVDDSRRSARAELDRLLAAADVAMVDDAPEQLRSRGLDGATLTARRPCE